MADRLLQQFARSPVPGAVKTRLMPALSAEAACDVHEELVRWSTRTLLASGLGPVDIWADGDLETGIFREGRSKGVRALRQQQGADLGERMCHALTSGLEEAARVCLVGSDCPAIDTVYLEAAFDALDSVDLVFGPAEDGGYVLIACSRRPARALFQDVQWGGAEVLSQSLERAERLGWSVALLDPLRDVDRPEDLPYWESVKRGGVNRPAGAG